MRKRTAGVVLVGMACLGLGVVWLRAEPEGGVIDVHPGEDIQAALEAAARRRVKPVVRVHAGVYRPAAPNEALVYFNARHDGIVLEGVGEVVLTAANPDVAEPGAESYPAVVNHVVYFGDGVSERTVLRNFTITGAAGFVRGPPDLRPVRTVFDLVGSMNYRAHASTIEANKSLPKTHYFYTDGGAILVYGRSYPTVEDVRVVGNRSCVCAGGVSVQHHGAAFEGAARFRNCTFRDNRAAVSGAAVDVLSPGSWVVLENCLFAGNVSDEKICLPGASRFGALTVFPSCRASVEGCTFTDNSSGVDDRGEGTYRRTIFWKNDRPGGVHPGPAFEVNLVNAAGVRDCYIGGGADLHANVGAGHNRLGAPDPEFDAEFRPTNPPYAEAGYRPARKN